MPGLQPEQIELSNNTQRILDKLAARATRLPASRTVDADPYIVGNLNTHQCASPIRYGAE